MDYMSIAKLLAEECWVIIWKDPTEGDRSWKTEFDGKASVNVDVGWMMENPNDKDEFILFRSRGVDLNDKEKGSEIYIPKACVKERYRLTLHGDKEQFQTDVIIKRERKI